jgi:polyphosphate kinase
VDGKYYQKQLRRLQTELVAMQEWVKNTGQRVIIIFEGRDAAGKGGMIKAISQRVSSRVFRTVALPAPNDREKSQLYLQRYIQHFPAAGEVILFDRSWYNRAGVEPVMGFCSPQETELFLHTTPEFEKGIVEDGIILLKYWLEVSTKEQEKRFKDRIKRPDKQWKLSSMDLEARRRWFEFSRARDRMLEATDTEECPWVIVPSDDKKLAHLNCISHMLDQIPYQPLGSAIVTLPKRDKTNAYDDKKSMQGRRYVPENYSSAD